jgi:hypothetical protein
MECESASLAERKVGYQLRTEVARWRSCSIKVFARKVPVALILTWLHWTALQGWVFMSLLSRGLYVAKGFVATRYHGLIVAIF